MTFEKVIIVITIMIGLGIGALSLVARAMVADPQVTGVTYDDFGLSFAFIGLVGAACIVLILLMSRGRD